MIARHVLRRGVMVSALCLLLVPAAACVPKKTISYQGLATAVARKDPPRRIAVMPFVDQTDTEALADLVRISFYSHLSAKSYQDIELHRIDRQLGPGPPPAPETLTPEQMTALGRRVGADALIFGRVTRFDRIFTGIYSQLCLAADIVVFDTRTGRLIWQDSHTTRFHEGGLPLTLIAIPFITLRSGLNLMETSKIRATDDLARHLTARIPIPDDAPNDSAQHYEVQAGAFLDEHHAAALIEELRAAGLAAFLQTRRLSDRHWFRVLLGPYANREQAAAVRDKIRKTTGAQAFIAAAEPSP